MKKKPVAMLLVAALSVSSLAACGGPADGAGGSVSSGSAEHSSEAPADSAADAEGAGGDGVGEYTYHRVTSGINTWNPTDWRDESEGDIIAYTVSTFYEFRMNDTKDGYDIVPELAAEMPQDVTAEYAGNEVYGVPADATAGYAWKIAMRQDAKWQDGSPLAAADVEYSAQQFLNPEMKNFRASTLFSGTLGLANAYAYYQNDRAGGINYALATDNEALSMADFAPAEDGQYADADGNGAYFGWSVAIDNDWVGGDAFSDYVDYMPEEIAAGLEALANGDGYIPVTQESYDLFYSFTGSDDWGNESEEDLINYLFYEDGTVEVTPWENVGFIKDDDYTFTLVLTNNCSEFDLIYNMAGLYLLNEELYEANKQETGGVVKSSYGTEVDKYSSYGPYKVVNYQPDKQMRLERNENWYGYTDGNHEGQYQTTALDIQWIEETTTQLSLFLQGNLDEYELTAEDVDTYGTSDFLYFKPETFTSYLSLNVDFDMLKSRETDGINKTIITYPDFRKAFSLSVDRTDYVRSCTAASQATYGLLNSLYICDPDTGTAYRDTEYAQQTLCDVYGVSNVSELTGYDKEQAAALLQSAYDQCYADGNIKDGDVVEIEYHVSGTESRYQKMVDFMDSALKEAAKGTSLEDRISVILVEDQDYYTSMRNGQDDMILCTPGGSDMDPYVMMQIYTDPGFIMEYGFDSSKPLTLSVAGEEMTKSFYDWYEALCYGEYAVADLDVRNEILAGIEKGILLDYHAIPVCSSTVATLYSQRTVLGSEEYINSLVEFGGLQFQTYTMDDAEWAAYCAEQGNSLTY